MLYFCAVKEEEKDLIRLNKLLAHAGLGTRRECDEIIKKGNVAVNGQKVSETGVKVSLSDKISYLGKTLNTEKKVYVLINKPKKTFFDKKYTYKPSLLDLVQSVQKKLSLSYFPSLKPVDLLDFDTLGLQLLTNDNDLIAQLNEQKHRQIFRIELDNTKSIPSHFFPKRWKFNQIDEKTFGVEVFAQSYKEIVEVFESNKISISKIDRTAFTFFSKKDLPRGRWRLLSTKEITRLKYG